MIKLQDLLNSIPWETHQAIRAHIDALQSEVERLRDTLDHARFKCTMLAGRTTYSPEQFENGRYVCGELAEEIKRVLVRREAVKPELEPGEYKRALRDAHDKIDALQSEVARLRHYADGMALKYCEIRDSKNAENARLRSALEGLIDDEACGYDHHGYCQAHFITKPCEMAVAREALQQSPVPSLSEEKKVKSKPLIAPDVCIWQDMAGDTALEKMLNAYLTSQFIGKRKLPVDECLSEARKVMRIVWAYGECADSGAAWDELGRAEFPEQSPETSQLEEKK